MTLNGREQYYKILETGMEWFGVSMNFLWIIEVLAIIFLLKIYLIIIFSDFIMFWAGRTISREPRGYSTTNPETQRTVALDGGLFSRKQEVSFAKDTREGVRCNLGRPIRSERSRLDQRAANRYAIRGVGSRSDGVDLMHTDLTRATRSSKAWSTVQS